MFLVVRQIVYGQQLQPSEDLPYVEHCNQHWHKKWAKTQEAALYRVPKITVYYCGKANGQCWLLSNINQYNFEKPNTESESTLHKYAAVFCY